MLDDAALRRLAAVQCFLLDMDGTFYLGEQLLEGSLAFLQALERTGRTALFLTNNSSKDADAYVEKLRRMGVEAPFLRVYTSGLATARYLRAAYPGRRVFLLGNEQLHAEMRREGVAIDQDAPELVVVAFDTTLDYAKMTRVCDLIRAGLPYIATHPDFNCPTEDGFMPDIGAIMAFIEASTGRKADVIIGKPHQGIVDGALEVAGCGASQCAMVGDRLYTDIATGVAFGMTAILVLTGEATMDDVGVSPVKPDLIFDRLSDMIPYLDATSRKDAV